MTSFEKHTQNTIIITSYISVKNNSINEFIQIAKKIIELTKKEKGCIEYKFLQDPFSLEKFFFYEVYVNKEAQLFHSNQDYLSEFKRLREPMLDGDPILKIYNAIEQ